MSEAQKPTKAKAKAKATTDASAAPMGGPEVGDAAPAFSGLRDGGGAVSLADFAGAPLVLYFYPKDDTSACTLEAIGFGAEAAAFAAVGARVLGVSKDPVASHDKFVAKHALKIPLLSDAEGDACERYGVWVEKSMYGKKYMGVERATFLIDGAGVVRRVWRKVKVEGHVAEVLAAVRAL